MEKESIDDKVLIKKTWAQKYGKYLLPWRFACGNR